MNVTSPWSGHPYTHIFIALVLERLCSGHRACVHGEGAPVPASVGRRRLVPLELEISDIGENVEPPMFCRLLTSNHRQTLGNQELK